MFNIFLIIVAILLKTKAFENNTEISDIINPQQNSSSSTEGDPSDEIIYVCEKQNNYEDICHCYWSQVLRCDHHRRNKIKTTNIKIKNETFVLKKAELKVDLTVLRKDKLLPGRENTVEELDFSFAKINELEAGVFDKFIKLSTLSLWWCRISNIDDKILTKSVGLTLTTLNLENNYLNYLSPNTFIYLHKLTSLNLGNNNISTSLTKELFSKSLGNLKELKLHVCNITFLNNDVFINLRSLDSLSLEDNPLTLIPKAINLLPNLNYLNMRNTQIQVLSNTANNKNLKHLNLKELKNLKFIDDCAFCGFPNLTELYISNDFSSNSLDKIHENAFGAFVGKNVSKLEKFDVSGSKIEVLPEKLLNWESLKEIKIDRNPFICNCSMAWLINDFVNPFPQYYKNIHGNLLTCHNPPKLIGKTFQEISGTICMKANAVIDNRIAVCENYSQNNACECDWDGKLTCKSWRFKPKTFVSLNLKIKDKDFVLKNVSFSFIPVKSLEKDKIIPGRHHTIEEFELKNNDINYIEPGVFDDFISLKTLKIIGNNFNTLNNSFLTEKVGLTLIELYLENNNIQTIAPTSFNYFVKLEKLSLKRCEGISNYITKELFSENLKTLKSLELIFCGIETLKEDVFENLINLEELLLILNPITAIPTALNSLSNLRYLNIGATDIVKLNNKNLKTLPKLETLGLKMMKNLISIEDCAFCSFPNLQTLVLSQSRSLEIIHENAFGAANGTHMPKLKLFSAFGCNITIFHENMLNWDSIDETYILFNPFICNCSMAWLINDFAYSNPKYVTHMKLDEPFMFNQTLKCAAPKELKDKTFKEISNKLCNTSFTETGIFERLETKIPPSNFSFLMAIILIIFGILISGLIIFIFNHRKRKPLENVSAPEETEKLNDEIVLNDL